MTSIFKSYDALTLLSKNLEKLGTTQETFTKAVIQTIGEMDSMMGDFLQNIAKETQKKVDKTTPGAVVDDDEESDDVVEDEDEESEEEEVVKKPITCDYCGKKDKDHPHMGSISGKKLGCIFTSKHQRGECKWITRDLYLLKDKWFIVATPSFGPFIVGKQAYDSQKWDLQILSSNKFEDPYKLQRRVDDGDTAPYPVIYSPTSKEAKTMKTEAKSTYELIIEYW